MSQEKQSYDWAEAALSLISTDSTDIRQLVEAAGLNASKGDLSDIDLSHIDLSNQDLSGWNLENANFRGAKLNNTNLHGSLIDPYAIIMADDWEIARLDPDVFKSARNLLLFVTEIQEMNISVRSSKGLKMAGVNYLGDLVVHTEGQLLRIHNFGRKALNEIKEILAGIGLRLGMDAPGWPLKSEKIAEVRSRIKL